MPYLKKYSLSSSKRGFYIDGASWTLQTTPATNRFFRQSVHYHDDTELPMTIPKALVHLGEAKTEARHTKAEMLDWFPRLRPSYCDMSDKEVREFRRFIKKRLEQSGLYESQFEDLNSFLEQETPISSFTWTEDYGPDR